MATGTLSLKTNLQSVLADSILSVSALPQAAHLSICYFAKVFVRFICDSFSPGVKAGASGFFAESVAQMVGAIDNCFRLLSIYLLINTAYGRNDDDIGGARLVV